MRACVAVLLLISVFGGQSRAQVRKVTVKDDNILTIRTALGIATIVQLPDVIQSAIIGDQSGFKVEYLDRAVTIKPLRWAAKTNLFLVTGKRRHNLRLQTGSQEAADYIVYIQNPEMNSPNTRWITVRRSSMSEDLKLTVERIGKTASGFLLLDVTLSSNMSQRISIKPGDIWIKQNGSSKVINGLFLSDLKIEKKTPARIGISLAKSDLVTGKAIVIEVRGQRSVSITVSEDLLWK